jgi:hypothetical protein
MTKESDRQLFICARLRELGYASQRHLRLYGEDFHLVSNPIPDGDGFAVEGIVGASGTVRHIRIPLSVVHTLRQELVIDVQAEIAA